MSGLVEAPPGLSREALGREILADAARLPPTRGRRDSYLRFQGARACNRVGFESVKHRFQGVRACKQLVSNQVKLTSH
jgi:hypothetical protein